MSTLWGQEASEEPDCEAVEVEAEAMKSIRLQKLLRKTDRFVAKIQQTMRQLTSSCEVSQQQRPSLHEMNTFNSSSSSSSKKCFTRAAYSLLAEECRLREYQQGGVEWMYSLCVSGLNGILADEMGLGKTIQVLAFFSALYDRCGSTGPHLVVMPLSVLTSWRSDIAKLTRPGAFNVLVHHGERDARAEELQRWYHKLKTQQQQQQQQRCVSPAAAGGRVALLLTTYELAMKDADLLRLFRRGPVRWDYLVVRLPCASPDC